MNKKIIKYLSLYLVFIIFISIFGGCTGKIPVATESEEPESPGTAIAETPITSTSPEAGDSQPVVSSPEADDVPQPLDFTWQPHVFSDIYQKVYGEKMQQTLYAMVDAVMTGAESFPCPDEETMYSLKTVADVCFPPYSILFSGINFRDGAVHVTYANDPEQHKQLLNQFIEQVSLIIRSAVMEGDSPGMAAISLYHAYSGMITYDYSAIDNEVFVDVSSYRALAELSGICQSFGPAYAYLCLQCGIDAVNAGGLNESFVAHDWTMLTLDGKYYYADPTFENGYGGLGLRCFGMTAAQREFEGGYIAEDYNIGNTNEIWGRDIDVTDERFDLLRYATWVESMQRENDGLHIQCVAADGTPFEFIVE